MYDSFYKLLEKPFQINTDPRFLWLGEKHREALANLEYGLVNHNGLVVLTGNIGTGKTTLVNTFLDTLNDKVCVAKINHTNLEPEQFLSLTAKTFDPDVVVSGKSDLLLFFHDFLKKEHANGRTVLLIVDEAHHLSVEIFEEIRLLTNIEEAGKSLLSVIFVGQRELMPILLSHQCRALRQRITLFYDIEALTSEETALYVQHRLKVSGARQPLFSPAAIEKIYAYTGGIPRTINRLCDRALLTGYVTGAYIVNEKIITECAREIDPLRRRSLPVFLTALNRIRACGVSLLRRTAKAGAEMKPKTKPAIDYLNSSFGRWHSKGSVFAKKVLSPSGRFMALRRRSIVMGLTASAVTILFATWTIHAFRVAVDQEPNIVLKRPKTVDDGPVPAFGDQQQKATAWHHRDMPTMDAADSASSSSKPPVLKLATTSAEKPLTHKAEALAPDSHLPVQVMLLDRTNMGLAEGNLTQAMEPVEANGMARPQVWGKRARRFTWPLMGRGAEMVEQSPADAERFLFKAKAPTLNHKVKWPQETLYSIALWYTGSGEHWKQIAAANPAIAPDQIHIGNSIAIPLSLIKTHTPMPSEFLNTRNTSGETPTAIQPSTPVEPSPLFGSIDHP